MTRRWAMLVGTVVLIAGVVLTYYRMTSAPDKPAFVTAPVTRGDVVETVDATGTLQAVTTVQVGTQVSGTIKALHADFNSNVRRGQVVAELEPSLFQAQVEQSRASIVRLQADARRATAQRDDAQQKLKRARQLSQEQLIPATELETSEAAARESEAAVEAADAQIVQARAALHQAEVNLAHTIITAPDRRHRDLPKCGCRPDGRSQHAGTDTIRDRSRSHQDASERARGGVRHRSRRDRPGGDVSGRCVPWPDIQRESVPGAARSNR